MTTTTMNRQARRAKQWDEYREKRRNYIGRLDSYLDDCRQYDEGIEYSKSAYECCEALNALEERRGFKQWDIVLNWAAKLIGQIYQQDGPSPTASDPNFDDSDLYN